MRAKARIPCEEAASGRRGDGCRAERPEPRRLATLGRLRRAVPSICRRWPSVILKVTPSVDASRPAGTASGALTARPRAFIRDWGPFVLILAAWGRCAGSRSGLIGPSRPVIAIERFFRERRRWAMRRSGRPVQRTTSLLTFLYSISFSRGLCLFCLWPTPAADYPSSSVCWRQASRPRVPYLRCPPRRLPVRRGRFDRRRKPHEESAAGAVRLDLSQPRTPVAASTPRCRCISDALSSCSCERAAPLRKAPSCARSVRQSTSPPPLRAGFLAESLSVIAYLLGPGGGCAGDRHRGRAFNAPNR